MRGNHKHGHKKSDSCSPEYLAWLNMKARCTNSGSINYHRYGGRGITVCAHWLHCFENFLADMGSKPQGMSLERIDNNGNYEPGNCRWATKSEQANNRKTSEFLEYAGQCHTISEWATIRGIGKSTLWHRIKVAGWSVDRALNEVVP